MNGRLAIVPARGGSKRVPGKNIRPFCGRPLISYVLRAADESGMFDNIHVSTDDPGITSVVSSLGFPPAFSRPAHLADDVTPLIPVIGDAARHFARLGKPPRTICMLYATAPLLSASILAEACRVFEADPGRRPLMSVAEFPVPVEWAFRMDAGNNLTPVQPQALTIRSQDLPHAYFEAAAFLFMPADPFLEGADSIDLSNMRGFLMPSERVTDIDTEANFRHAEALYRAVEGQQQ